MSRFWGSLSTCTHKKNAAGWHGLKRRSPGHARQPPQHQGLAPTGRLRCILLTAVSQSPEAAAQLPTSYASCICVNRAAASSCCATFATCLAVGRRSVAHIQPGGTTARLCCRSTASLQPTAGAHWCAHLVGVQRGGQLAEGAPDLLLAGGGRHAQQCIIAAVVRLLGHRASRGCRRWSTHSSVRVAAGLQGAQPGAG